MTKAEIIEAIQSTIVANNQKAITAESLANLLIEMANATPEPEEEDNGKGQVVFYLGTPNEEIDEFVLTSEQQVHNAKMYQVVRDSEVALNASLDMSAWYQAMIQQEDGIYVAGIKYNVFSSVTVYMDADAAAQLGAPSSGVGLTTETGQFLIMEDGTVILPPL